MITNSCGLYAIFLFTSIGSDVICRGLTCLWLVAVTQFAALVVVTLVQQLHFADLTQRDLQLRGLLSHFLSSTHHDEQLTSEALKENVIAGHCSNASKVCVKGPKGEPGALGTAGPPGQNGVSGGEGPRGQDGPMGPKGGVGVSGQNGPPGPLGENGPVGAAGLKGDVGAKGDIGNMGARGEPGPEGIQGPKGEPGSPGDQGPAGPKGALGLQGQKGETGGAGAKGIPGPAGPVGDSAVSLGSDCECLRAPRILSNFPSDMAVTLDSPVQLTCQAEGNPAPEVTWSGHQSAELRIDHVFRSDLRPYTCTATNPFGTDTVNVTLHT